MEAFLVRVWKAGIGEPYAGLRGTVVHLPSGRLLAFSDPSSLLDFLTDSPPPEVEQEPSGEVGRRRLTDQA
jgi:hypothetical protein